MRPQLAEELDLAPHPEGGWYRETWRADTTVTPAGYGGARPTATAIYFLLQPGERSRWHVVRSAELWLWHAGGPLRLGLGGTGASPIDATPVLLGIDLASGHRPQVVIPGGTWQEAEPAGDEAVLVSCVVSPGFDFADFRLL